MLTTIPGVFNATIDMSLVVDIVQASWMKSNGIELLHVRFLVLIKVCRSRKAWRGFIFLSNTTPITQKGVDTDFLALVRSHCTSLSTTLGKIAILVLPWSYGFYGSAWPCIHSLQMLPQGNHCQTWQLIPLHYQFFLQRYRHTRTEQNPGWKDSGCTSWVQPVGWTKVLN